MYVLMSICIIMHLIKIIFINYISFSITSINSSLKLINALNKKEAFKILDSFPENMLVCYVIAHLFDFMFTIFSIIISLLMPNIEFKIAFLIMFSLIFILIKIKKKFMSYKIPTIIESTLSICTVLLSWYVTKHI